MRRFVVLGLLGAVVASSPSPAHAFVSPSNVTVTGCRGMAQIPGGSYLLGEAKRSSTVAPFCMDRYEVTVDAYAACVARKECTDEGLTKYGASSNWGKPERGKHPINTVTWFQATAFCAAHGKRLPTEDEWEWAARGGTNGFTYAWGNEAPANQWCWSSPPSHQPSSCPVGSFSPNVFGVYDLSGNVWEWTSSLRSGEGSGYVFRGGSWGSSDGIQARTDIRGGDQPEWRDPDVGFRCVRSI